MRTSSGLCWVKWRVYIFVKRGPANKTLPHAVRLNCIRQVKSIHYIYTYIYIYTRKKERKKEERGRKKEIETPFKVRFSKALVLLHSLL